MDWITQDRITEFEFSDSLGHFLEQYCNHGICNITRIIELGSSIEDSLQNIYLVGKNQKSKIKIVITQQKKIIKQHFSLFKFLDIVKIGIIKSYQI